MIAPAGQFQACIFDFDGVIVDSEPVHERACRLTLDHFGIAYPPDLFATLIGKSEALIARYIKEHLDPGDVTEDELIAYKHRMYAGLAGEVPLYPDAGPFVQAARRRFGRLGLATSAIRVDVDRAVRRFGMEGWFDAIVTVDDTPRHKPDPAPYLLVLRSLGVAPKAALVIEDTPSGLTSARAAGCVTAGVTTTFSAEELRAAGADIIAGSLGELGQVLGLPLAAPA
jgi:beta-phosphoglucomutase